MNRFWSGFVLLLVVAALVACASPATAPSGNSLALAAFTENGVSVAIALEKDSSSQYWLSGTFTPGQKGFHLYSKDLPRNGINGQGRPTLVEIPPGSDIRVRGDVAESAYAEVSSMGPGTLLVYPAGAVTLRLPITLPAGESWMDEQVQITYEACSDMSCLTPVVGKLVSIRLPGSALVKP